MWTDRAVDTDGILVANGGILPSFVDRKTGRTAVAQGDATLLGNELNAAMTWRFGPGLSLDAAAGYLFAGGAFGHRAVPAPYCDGAPTPSTNCIGPVRKDLQVNDVMIATMRVRFTF